MSLPDTEPNHTNGTVAGYLGDYPDVDRHSCQLLGPTALIVQGLMGALVILSLVYKRHREKPIRPWKIWLFDVSKQAVGQMFVHGVNVMVSDIVSHHSSANACVFYFLNILIDTTLGVALIYLILHVLTYLLSEKFTFKGFESGKYGTPPSVNYWARQAAIYVLALTTMKLLVLALLILFPGIFKIGEWLLSWTWTGEGDSLQVIFTMGLFPIIMNVLQFWLIDSIVKASAVSSVSLDSETPDAFDHRDREPLFGVPSDDEDDDMSGPHNHDIENPRIVSRSCSPSDPPSHSRDKSTTGSSTPYEQKSSGSTTPGQAVEMHAYPPSLSSSIASTSTQSSVTPKQASKLNQPKRRSPPTPLNIRTAHQPAINSPRVSVPAHSPHSVAPSNLKESQAVNVANGSDKEWADSWDDSDDWANRVGEEEWTGRRMDEKKDILNDTWDTTAAVLVGS